jgi:AcrR family transcriptional regulator
MKLHETPRARREPKQQRSRQTVDAVLEAVQRVVERQGPEAITTNRIAEAAGVSVGSLYQYFPNKQAIFSALHDRHVEDVRRVVEQTTTACAEASLTEFSRELVHGLVAVHSELGELHGVVASAVPGAGLGFERALAHTFREALTRADRKYTLDERERMLFVLPRLVESLVHGTTEHAASSRDRAANEALRTVKLYVESCAGASGARS